MGGEEGVIEGWAEGGGEEGVIEGWAEGEGPMIEGWAEGGEEGVIEGPGEGWGQRRSNRRLVWGGSQYTPLPWI